MNGSTEQLSTLILIGLLFLACGYLFRGFDRFIGRKSMRDITKGTRELANESRLLQDEIRQQTKYRSRMRDNIGDMAKKKPEKIASILQQWLLNGNGNALP